MSDRTALLEILRARTGRSDLEFELEPTNLKGGFWAELLAFRLRESPDGWPRDLVARLMPDPVMAAKETVFQAEVADQGFPTPIVRMSGDQDAGLGCAFMIMDLVDGGPLLGGLSGVSALLRLPKIARGIPDSLAGAMAHLHSLSPEKVRTRLDGGRAVSVGDVLTQFSLAAERNDRVDLVAAAQWLQTNQPESAREVICHGDLHPFNLLKGDSGVTVVDWSAAIIGPPEYDAAFTSLVLAEPPLSVPKALGPVVRAGGRWLSRRFIRQYGALAPQPLDRQRLAWNQGLICLRALTEVSSWVASGTLKEHRGHPWLISGAAFAERLSALTSHAVAPL